MPVTTQHNEYHKMSSEWQKMRDCVAGQKRIHEQGEKYLPQLSGQDRREYDGYKGRALFLNATGKTVDSLVGTVFRKPTEYEIPESMQSWAEDITASGITLDQLCRECMEEILTPGRYGLLVDYPNVEEAGRRTVAEIEAQGLRPRIKQYTAENIINWKTDTINNREVLSMVVLSEKKPDPEDEFDTNSTLDQHRVLDLTEDGYRMRVFDEEGVVVSEVYPKMNGRPMRFIPFLIVGTDGENVSVDKPPLLDLANINLSHYKAYADYRHGLHFTGLPTPVIKGAEEPDGGIYIGSTRAMVFPQPEADAFFLEFEGKGLDEYKDEIARLETSMAIFGAMVLREQKKAAEAAETAAINRVGETSLLASWAQVVGNSIEHALEIARDWAGLSGDINIKLNMDYMPMQIDSSLLRELTSALVANKISYDTYWRQLVKGEIGLESRTAEEELDLIDMDGPVGPGVGVIDE